MVMELQKFRFIFPFFDLRKAGRKREILRITDNIEIVIIPYKSAVRSG